MFIKQITIKGHDGGDVIIARTEYGCEVHHAGQRIACIERSDTNVEQFEHARVVAGAIYGWVPQRGTVGCVVPNATNSMIREVMSEMQRVAGC